MIKLKLGKRRKLKNEPNSTANKHDISESPFLWKESKVFLGAIKIDNISKEEGRVTATGWHAFKGSPTLHLKHNGERLDTRVHYICREDAEESIKKTEGSSDHTVSGFILTTKTLPPDTNHLYLSWTPDSQSPPLDFSLPIPEASLAPPESLVNSTEIHQAHNRMTKVEEAESLQERKAVVESIQHPAALLKGATWASADPLVGQAHIDVSGIIPGRCGLLAGWAVSMPGWPLFVMDNKGNCRPISDAVCYQREDIVDLFRENYGQSTVNGGFVINWPYPLQGDEKFSIIAFNHTSNVAVKLAENKPTKISFDPEGYARWAFNVPTPAEKFNDRLNKWEGALLEALIRDRNAHFDKNESNPDIMVLGKPVESPCVSIIIPLYNRWDFVEHQLIAFSKDPELLDTAEIIYVVDDPRILTAVSNEVENLYNLYEVPFKLVWGHRNRGFSGANNFGVSLSRGRQVLYLNSDAFPITPGWLNNLSILLDKNPEYGMLGVRLLNPEGGMQHAGMEFVYSTSWDVWLNKHPMAGLAPELDDIPEGKAIIEKPAVTGACVLITRELNETIGGFDEGYLIGDFEDSDLCLKVLQQGKKVGYVPSIELVHLERQSFSSLGDTSFRTLVVRFNAWRHTKRWSNQINDLMKRFS